MYEVVHYEFIEEDGRIVQTIEEILYESEALAEALENFILSEPSNTNCCLVLEEYKNNVSTRVLEAQLSKLGVAQQEKLLFMIYNNEVEAYIKECVSVHRARKHGSVLYTKYQTTSDIMEDFKEYVESETLARIEFHREVANNLRNIGT